MYSTDLSRITMLQLFTLWPRALAAVNQPLTARLTAIALISGATTPLLTLQLLTVQSVQAQTPTLKPQTPEATITCTYDPSLGKPNPLGMRSFISITAQGDTVSFKYEQFPSNVGGNPNQPATIAQTRVLTLYKTSLEKARTLLVTTPKYYEELVGFSDPYGFKPINDVLVCRSGGKPVGKNPTPAPGPTTGPTTPASNPLAALPDGNYRFWSGTTTSVAVSNEELLKKGGILFFFSKRGDRIVGNYSQIDGDRGICLTGTAAAPGVTGTALQFDSSIISSNDTPASWDPSGFLKVSNGKAIASDRVEYAKATLDLSGFTRINVGTRRPPTRCQ